MPLQGVDVNMIYIFPAEVNPQQLEAFFTRPGVSIRKIVQGTVVRGKIVPFVRAPNTGLRRSSRLAQLPKKEAPSNWIVAAVIHYPNPMIDIKRSIENSFGKNVVKTKNFTDYDAMVPSMTGVQITGPDAPVGVGAVAVAADNDDEMGGLANLFGQQGIGGKRSSKRRRITRKRRTHIRKTKTRSSRN